MVRHSDRAEMYHQSMWSQNLIISQSCSSTQLCPEILILPTMNKKVDFYNVDSKYLHIIFGIPLQRIATYLIVISSEEELAEEAAEVLDADDSKFRCKHYKRKCQFVVSLVPGPVPGQVVTRC